MDIEIKNGGYVLFFGIPLCTTAIVLSGVLAGRYAMPPIIVQVETRPTVNAEFPEGSVHVNAPVSVTVPQPRMDPPTVIVQEIIREKAVVSPVTVENKIPEQPAPVLNIKFPDRLTVAVSDMPSIRVIDQIGSDGSRGLKPPLPAPSK